MDTSATATTTTRMRDEWAVGLHQFLRHRLRTPSYVAAAAAAARSRTRVGVPAPLPHTQSLIDGVVWAIDDHAAWSLIAWQMICTHVRETAERCARVLATMTQEQQQSSSSVVHEHTRMPPLSLTSPHVATAAAATASTSLVAGDATTTTTAAAVTAPHADSSGSVARRTWRASEHAYDAYAVVQDAYMALAVVDACVKCDVDDGGQLRAAVARDVAVLVSDYCPLFALHGRHALLDEALAAYRDSFLDVLRAWRTTHALQRVTHARLEERLRFRLKSTRDAAASSSSSSSSVRARMAAAHALRDAVAVLSSSSSSVHDTHVATHDRTHTRHGTLYDDDNNKSNTTSSHAASAARVYDGSNSGSNGGGVAVDDGASVARTREAAERAVRGFIASVALPRRTQGSSSSSGSADATATAAGNVSSSSRNNGSARWRCPHCGAPMASEAARDAHYRVHFALHNVLQASTKAVRLTYPTAHDFVQHTGDVQRSGYYTLAVAALEEVYQQRSGGGVGERGAVRLRTRAAAAAAATATHDDDDDADDATTTTMRR